MDCLTIRRVTCRSTLHVARRRTHRVGRGRGITDHVGGRRLYTSVLQEFAQADILGAETGIVVAEPLIVLHDFFDEIENLLEDLAQGRVRNTLDIQPQLLHELNKFRGIHSTPILCARSSPAANQGAAGYRIPSSTVPPGREPSAPFQTFAEAERRRRLASVVPHRVWRCSHAGHRPPLRPCSLGWQPPAALKCRATNATLQHARRTGSANTYLSYRASLVKVLSSVNNRSASASVGSSGIAMK